MSVPLLGEAGSDQAVDPPVGGGRVSGRVLTATGLPERPDPLTAAPPQAAASPTGCSPLSLAIIRAHIAWQRSQPQTFLDIEV